jgi:acetyl esterase/lipase
MTSSLRDPMASHYSWMFTSRRIEVPHAAVILVHGGGWSAGSKRANFIQPLFAPLDESGLAWFSIDYRLAPYPAAVRDVEGAIRHIKTHGRDYRIDPKRAERIGEISRLFISGSG